MHRLTQRQVNITVQKKVSHWWERLTKQEKRPLFLAPDFDRWLDESDAEMELRAKVSKHAKPSLLKMEIVRVDRMGTHYTLAGRPGDRIVGHLPWKCGRLLPSGFLWCLLEGQVKVIVSVGEVKYHSYHMLKISEHCWPRQCLSGSSPGSSRYLEGSRYVDSPFRVVSYVSISFV